MKTVAFKTLGCKVNQYETQLMRERLINAGFLETKGPADVYVINTCTVTRKSDSESRRLIRNAKRQNPDSKIIVTGCYAELDADRNAVEKIADDLLILSNSKKDNILQYFPPKADPPPAGASDIKSATNISYFEGRTKAFVKVQDGCDNFCTYCKVPLVRGRSRSRKPDEIIAEIGRIISSGYKEIILTGICLGDWGRDLNLKLSWLLSEIETNIDAEFRLRLSSIEPWYVTSGLIKKIADSDKICNHLHIPMQSGDDEILKKMNRNFRVKDFLDLIDKARSLIPEIAFTTDVLVGFPGETDEHFNSTLGAVEITRPSRSHIFPFSMREGTKISLSGADRMPGQIVRERIKRLKSLTDRLAGEYKSKFFGKSVKVLVETERDKKTGLLTGFTDTYLKAVFKGNDELKGTLQTVVL